MHKIHNLNTFKGSLAKIYTGTLGFLPATLLADHLKRLPTRGIVSDLLNPPVCCRIEKLDLSLPNESLNTEYISHNLQFFHVRSQCDLAQETMPG